MTPTPIYDAVAEELGWSPDDVTPYVPEDPAD
jgi:hypothetical protein